MLPFTASVARSALRLGGWALPQSERSLSTSASMLRTTFSASPRRPWSKSQRGLSGTWRRTSSTENAQEAAEAEGKTLQPIE